MQMFEKELVMLSETVLKMQHESSLTYWKMNNEEGQNEYNYIENQHVKSINAFKSIIQKKKD